MLLLTGMTILLLHCELFTKKLCDRLFYYLKDCMLMLFCTERPNVRKKQSAIYCYVGIFFSFCGRKSGEMNEL